LNIFATHAADNVTYKHVESAAGYWWMGWMPK